MCIRDRRLADAELGANGELAALVQRAGPDPPNGDSPVDFAHPNRREVLAFGSSLFLPLGINEADAETAAEDPQTRLYYRDQFDQLRKRGQQSAPGLVLRTIAVEYCTLVELAEAAPYPSSRASFEILAARYAEYAGWMAQEAGDNQSSMAWTRQSAKLAESAGDQALAAYALVREAELAMYARDAARTISLAQQAQQHPGADPRVLALAAHREAQGHAMLNNSRDCRAALDRAETLLANGVPDGPGGSPLGSTTVADLNLAVSGWCTFDLGRPKQAAELLERALARTAPTARRARAMFGARLALAYEATSDLDRMLSLIHTGTAQADPCHGTQAQLPSSKTITRRNHGRTFRVSCFLTVSATGNTFRARREPTIVYITSWWQIHEGRRLPSRRAS